MLVGIHHLPSEVAERPAVQTFSFDVHRKQSREKGICVKSRPFVIMLQATHERLDHVVAPSPFQCDPNEVVRVSLKPIDGAIVGARPLLSWPVQISGLIDRQNFFGFLCEGVGLLGL